MSKNEGLRRDGLDISHRRNNAREALRFALVVFALSMILGVLWDALFGSIVDFERVFWFSLIFAPAIGVASMLVKITPVISK